jgi:CRP-like cAMP-binding protein
MAKNSSRVSRSFKSSSTGVDGHSVRNEILRGLPRKECALIFSMLAPVELKLHDRLQEAGEEVEFAYFPNTAMASIIHLMEDGKSIEVGLTGKEGFIGLALFAGFRTSANRVITQGAGTAFRINARNFREVLRLCPRLTTLLLRYAQKVAMQSAQIAACNRLHEVDERLARWLLMTHDRIGSDDLPLTQEFLAHMLGIRRASVSVSAATLQKAGLIRYIHGRVKILNRKDLEKASCECYGAMQRQIETWNKES